MLAILSDLIYIFGGSIFILLAASTPSISIFSRIMPPPITPVLSNIL